MFNKSVLVTGCDSGIGLSLCRTLPEKNYFVIAGCKTKKGKEEVDSIFSNMKTKLENSIKNKECVNDSGYKDTCPESVGISVLLDVTSYDSVKELVSLYSLKNENKKIPNLYSIINNAGIWRFSTLEESCLNAENTEEELERWKCVLDTNLMGSIRVTLSFFPLLKKYDGDKNPRIIFITSVVDEMAVPGQFSYVSSKFALRGFHEALLHELINSKVKSVCITPGALHDTNLFDFDLDNFEIDKEYKLKETLRLKTGLRRLRKLASTNKGVVKTVVKALDSKNPRKCYGNTSGTLIFRVSRLLPRWLYRRIVHVVLYNMEEVLNKYKILNKLTKFILR